MSALARRTDDDCYSCAANDADFNGGPWTRTKFHYDQDGHLIAETGDGGLLIQREYVWLEDLPLAIESTAYRPEVITDNTDTAFAAAGSWVSSTTPTGFHGSDYRARPAAGEPAGTVVLDDLHATVDTPPSGEWVPLTTLPTGAYGPLYFRSDGLQAGSFTWDVPLVSPGKFRVYARWVSDATFAPDAEYTITHVAGATTVNADQRSHGGAWNLLGTFEFTTSALVTLNAQAGGAVIADAIRVVPVSMIDPAAWNAPEAQSYDVYARWPAAVTHSRWAVFQVTHGGGTTELLRDQQSGGGWSLLGTYTFASTAQGVRLSADPDSAVAADAVRFVPVGASVTATTFAYAHPDHLGTVQKMTDSTQAVVWDAIYRPFDEATISKQPYFENPLRFPGQYFDEETGLHQNWYRDYDPSIGRYLQSDRIGLKGGINTYAYVRSNPISLTDPKGLEVGAAYGAVYRADQAPTPGAQGWGPSQCSYYEKQCKNDGCKWDAYACNAKKCCESFGDNPSSNCTRKCLIETDQAECAGLDGDERNKCRFRAHAKCYASCGNVNDLFKKPWSAPECQAAMDAMGGVFGGYIR